MGSSSELQEKILLLQYPTGAALVLRLMIGATGQLDPRGRLAIGRVIRAAMLADDAQRRQRGVRIDGAAGIVPSGIPAEQLQLILVRGVEVQLAGELLVARLLGRRLVGVTARPASATLKARTARNA